MTRLSRLGTVLAITVALGLAVGAGGASAKGGHCSKAGSCTPQIESVAASNITENSVTLEAVILAKAGTKYEIWLSYAPCQGGAGECPKPIRKKKIGHGKLPASNTAQTVSQNVVLTPGCTYTYWFVAGTVESVHESFTAAGGTAGPKKCSR